MEGAREASENYETSVIDCLRCKHVSRRLQEEPLDSKQTHVHLDVRRICFNLQIQRPKLRVSNGVASKSGITFRRF